MAKKVIDKNESGEVVTQMGELIIKTLNDFDVAVELVGAKEGIRFYHFSLKATKSVRMKTVKSFEDDLRYALASNKLEIEAPIPDQQLIGVTVPKKITPQVLFWKDAIQSKKLPSSDLSVPLGVDEYGEEYFLDIAKMPHVLIGGTTGSGKSVLLHSVINSLIHKLGPDRLRFILVDTKRVELVQYDGLPHLLTTPISDPKKVVLSLKWAIKEMERRFDLLQEKRCMNIASYHKTIGKKDEPMPYIVIVIDEIADLMQAYPNELESALVRLLQMCRAVGIHIIISTQRPSVNVITGTLKANIPSRIAMQVASQIDSRTIIDQAGAEKLQGAGDLLFQDMDNFRPKRIQSYYISEDEVRKNIKTACKVNGLDLDRLNLDSSPSNADDFFENSDDEDDLYEDAKQAVLEAGKASTSFIQRKLRIGYSRAARLIDILEEKGVIGSADGAAPRIINYEVGK